MGTYVQDGWALKYLYESDIVPTRSREGPLTVSARALNPLESIDC